ncbi:hypothetical protein BDP27DRAFT_1361204 [Rhodocollybia butyracea]|uniref:Uncharacterized protein n=1 Tax=Rhodocollybia butyracea TaxID=206335 RepID=A0A9P5U9M7_9AGAR|nr:hypothetical protein BDP27DRAFT_1361204 [Rhodocollybia butyracea]
MDSPLTRSTVFSTPSVLSEKATNSDKLHPRDAMDAQLAHDLTGSVVPFLCFLEWYPIPLYRKIHSTFFGYIHAKGDSTIFRQIRDVSDEEIVNFTETAVGWEKYRSCRYKKAFETWLTSTLSAHAHTT